MRRAVMGFVLASALVVLAIVASPHAHAQAPVATPLLSSTSAGVTVYGATWCSACKSLEQGLRERDVPFDVIDVEQNARAYETARRATGVNVIPITSIAKSSDVAWVVGADAAAVERAYRGE